MFIAGGTAGAIARTATAPLDRIKLLFQVQVDFSMQVHLAGHAFSSHMIYGLSECTVNIQAVASSGTGSKAYTGVLQAASKILSEEGFFAFWKGNSLNVVRVFPYSAAQLASNDSYKRLLSG